MFLLLLNKHSLNPGGVYIIKQLSNSILSNINFKRVITRNQVENQFTATDKAHRVGSVNYEFMQTRLTTTIVSLCSPVGNPWCYEKYSDLITKIGIFRHQFRATSLLVGCIDVIELLGKYREKIDEGYFLQNKANISPVRTE